MRAVNTIINHFIECLLWTETNEDGDPLDTVYGPEDISQECLAEIRQDCYDFYHDALPLINKTQLTFEQVGHDFCLTRNGHGAGFWDRGLGEVGDKLTDLCEPYGSVNLYVGDDDKLYC